MYAGTIFSLVFSYMIFAIKADCNCGDYIGVHCGERSSDGSNGLKGSCNPNIIYQCPAANVPAQSKGYCSYCAKDGKIGTDYCAIGKEGINVYLTRFFHSNYRIFL